MREDVLHLLPERLHDDAYRIAVSADDRTRELPGLLHGDVGRKRRHVGIAPASITTGRSAASA